MHCCICGIGKWLDSPMTKGWWWLAIPPETTGDYAHVTDTVLRQWQEANFNCFTRMQKTRKLQLLLGSNNTVDGRNPAPVDRWFRFIPLFIGFQPSFWWCRISSIHSMSRATPTAYIGPTGLLSLIIPSGYNQSPVKHPDRHSNSLTPFHLT